MEKIKNSHTILVVKPEGKLQLGGRKRKWKDNIRRELKEIVGSI
jgi:hypothetical protein